jgi:hypothetical protein
MRELDGLDLSKVIYPMAITFTGWYIVANLYRISTQWNWAPLMIVYTIAFTLVPIGFVYIALKGVRLRFKLSILSIIGMIMVAVFVQEAISTFQDPNLTFSDIFLTGQWDHTFFPIAFGLLFLCDLSRIPKRFWQLLTPFAILTQVGNLNVISNIFFDTWILHAAPGFFNFFGADNWAEFNCLEEQQFVGGFIGFLSEYLTFYTLFPAVILRHLLKHERS